jgi:hypothetical protein
MLNRIVRSMIVSAMILPAFGAYAAGPWVQAQVLTPPVEAGFTSMSTIGFGRVVAMSDEWLTVAAPAGSCTSPTGHLSGTVLIYRYDSATQGFVYSQQLCGTGGVESIALWNGWMVMGSPHDDDTPGDNSQHGRVRFYKLSGATQQWSLTQSAAGAFDSLLGTSVAIGGGVIAAGESGYNEHRGRVQTWRLNTMGTAWVSEGYLGPAVSPLTPRVAPDEGFGSDLALDVGGCRAPSCAKPHDTMIVQSRSGLHSIERLASGWGSRALVKPARGTTTAFSPVAINGSIAVAGAIVMSDNTGDSPCPWIGPDYYSQMTRVLTRTPGTAHLTSKGFACMDQLGVTPLRSGGVNVAVPPQGSEFVVGIPEYPASYLGVVATWDLSGAGGTIQPTDFVVDLDYTEAYYAATSQSFLYTPSFTGDYFGGSVAVLNDRLAVGAPFYNAFIGALGAGYVVVYTR